jgi:SAM-dependent methyltransferase
MPTNTGIYTVEDASIGHLHSRTLASKLTGIFDKERVVIDFGCGRGEYLKYLKDDDFKVIGIDGINVSSEQFIIEKDLSAEFNLDVKGNVISLEVGEHIPAQYESVFLKNIINHCDGKLLLSWAIIGQPGIGHINCRDNKYIIDTVREYGFRYEDKITEWLREDIESQCSYFTKSLMYFTR